MARSSTLQGVSTEDLTQHTETTSHPETGAESRGTAVVMLVTGAVALFAAITLIVDKVRLLESEAAGTDTTLGCDLNAFVSCGGVINTDQASVFGFPNPIMGIVGFSVVVTLAVLLLAGATFPRWIWAGLLAGTVFGIGFVTWLQYQSIYEIQKLCPWCMVVWAMMIPLFVVVAARTLREIAPRAGLTRFLGNWTVLVVVLWYVAVTSAIWFQFGTNLWA